VTAAGLTYPWRLAFFGLTLGVSTWVAAGSVLGAVVRFAGLPRRR